jgi:hypothetical protein
MTSVVDRHCFDADSDSVPTLHVDADPDPDWHQNDAHPYADPSPSFTPVEEVRGFSLLFTAIPVYNDFPVSSIVKMSLFRIE